MGFRGTEVLVEEAGGPKVGEETPASAKKGTRVGKSASVRTAKVRKHKLTTAYKQDVAEQLDKLHAEGHETVAVLPSPDVRGFEIISYVEEEKPLPTS